MDKKLVAAKEWLYRRSYSTPEKKYMNPDGTATSRVFKPRPVDKGMLSVDVKSMITPAKSVKDSAKYILFELPNSSVMELDLSTVHDPLPDGSNDAHALICTIDDFDDIKPGLLARRSRRQYL